MFQQELRFSGRFNSWKLNDFIIIILITILITLLFHISIIQNIEEAAPSPQPFSTPPSPPHHPKLFFRLPDGKVASLYRALLFPKAERSERGGGGGAAETLERAEGGVEKLKEIVNGFADLKTVVILTGGGHFAAAVFQGDQVLEVRG